MADDLLGRVYVEVRAQVEHLPEDMAVADEAMEQFQQAQLAREKELIAFGQSVKASLKSPEEKHREQLQLLDEALAKDKITQAEHAQAVKNAGDAFAMATDKSAQFVATLKHQAMAVLPFLTVAGAIAKVRSELMQSAAAFEQQANANARLDAVLTATSHAAGLSAEQLQDQAAAMQAATGVSSASVETAQATLLRFKNVQGDMFLQTIALSEDLSVALGKDLTTVTMALGRALENPAQGLRALSRLNITFTKSEQERIKTLLAAGNMDAAQALVLKKAAELRGSAMVNAARNPLTPLKVLREALGDVRIAIGEKLIPFQILATQITKHFAEALNFAMIAAWGIVSPIVRLDRAMDGLLSAFAVGTAAVLTMAASFSVLKSAASSAITWINANLVASGWGTILIGIGLLIASITAGLFWISRSDSFTKAWKQSLDQLADAWELFEPIIVSLINVVFDLIDAFSPVLDILGIKMPRDFKTVQEAVGGVLGAMVNGATSFILEVAETLSTLVTHWKVVFEAIQLLAMAHFARMAEIAAYGRIDMGSEAFMKEALGKYYWLGQQKLELEKRRGNNFKPGPKTLPDDPTNDFSGFIGAVELSKRMQEALLKSEDPMLAGQNRLIGVAEEQKAIQKGILQAVTKPGLATADK